MKSFPFAGYLSRNPKSLHFLVLSLALVPFSGAEEADLHFSIFPLKRGDWTGIYYAPTGNPEKLVELHFNPQERSRDYPYQGPSPLRLYRKQNLADSSIHLRNVAQIDLPPSQNKLILLFSPRRSPEFAKIFIIADDAEHYPPNSLLLINTLNRTVTGNLASEQVELASGGTHSVDLSTFPNQYIPISLGIMEKDAFYPVVQNQWFVSPGRRNLLILHPPTRPNSLRIRTQRISELNPTDEKKSQSTQ